MGELLEVGEKIQTASGVECSVVKFLGGGGQGEVYESNWGGQSYALKWYFKQGNKPSKNATITDWKASS